MRFLIPLLLIWRCHAADDCFGIPDWILPGILLVESSSTYLADGNIFVGNHRRGSAGELGCFQITHAAFVTVARRGESFRRVATDTTFAEEIAARYVLYLHRKHGSWVAAVMAYNTGKAGTKAGRRYLNKVYKAMGMN